MKNMKYYKFYVTIKNNFDFTLTDAVIRFYHNRSEISDSKFRNSEL